MKIKSNHVRGKENENLHKKKLIQQQHHTLSANALGGFRALYYTISATCYTCEAHERGGYTFNFEYFTLTTSQDKAQGGGRDLRFRNREQLKRFSKYRKEKTF